MTLLATLNRMAPTAMKRVGTASIKPTAVALTQRRFNSTSGTEVNIILWTFFFKNKIKLIFSNNQYKN